MRKWLGIAVVIAVLVGLSAYWHFTSNVTDPGPDVGPGVQGSTNPVVKDRRKDGDAELSDIFEPLVVDQGRPTRVLDILPPVDFEPMQRAVHKPGMPVPPRPDAEPGKVLRMPYADEEELFPQSRDPIARILESTLPPLQLPEDPNGQGESRDESPSPFMMPNQLHHHQHCPYHGGCPYPARDYGGVKQTRNP